MVKVESKIGTINRDVSDVYNLLSNFDYISRYLHFSEVQDIKVEDNRCSFTLNNQRVSIVILEKEENNYIKFGSDENSAIKFFFWIQMKSAGPYLTKIKLTIHMEVPLLFRMMVKKLLEKGLNEAVDMLSKI